MLDKIEVLAPAGNFETLKEAIQSGADAVYVGGEKFSARAYAVNFTQEELLSAIDYVHLYGKRIYLTVNTLVKEKEFDSLYDFLLPFYQQGLDAVIVQDVGVMDYILKQFPGLGIHASTQMTITNAISARYLESLGVERVVPARELSLKEIKEIRDTTNLEIECFVHGALCYCYSGQCLMSSMIGGRSGNRGQCAQPCRLPYQVENQKTMDILSLKDLCTVEHIPDLVENGITSFKIEGRMKQPQYVQTVVRMYRKYLDLYLKNGRVGFSVSAKDKKILLNAYQRRGYTNGYYYAHNGKDMLSLEQPKAEQRTEWIPSAERKLQADGYLTLIEGQEMSFYVSCGDIHVTVTGPLVQTAAKQPANEADVSKRMKKTGNTPFEFENLSVYIEGNAFAPVQALNQLRREALDQVQQKIMEQHRRAEVSRIQMDHEEQKFSQEFPITALVETVEQFQAVVDKTEISVIYLEDSIWMNQLNKKAILDLIQQAHGNGQKVYWAMARIFRHEAVEAYQKHLKEMLEHVDGVLVRNLESYLYVKERFSSFSIVADYSNYQWNKNAKDWWKNQEVQYSTAPLELNRRELSELGINGMEYVVYGYLPVMISAGCVKKNTSGCNRKNELLSMKDRYKKKVFIKCNCNYCYNVIYNSTPLLLLEKEEMESLRPGSIRLQFSIENKKETERILEQIIGYYKEGSDSVIVDADYTKGHFKRGVK